MKNKLADNLKRLIQFKTITGNFEENQKAIDWIKNELSDLDLYIEEFIIGGKQSVIFTTKKTKRPTLFLSAHLDVVPGPDYLFEPKEKNGRLYGRGASDMKFAIACFIALFNDLGDINDYNLGLMITTDEEVGGFDGAGYLAKKGYLPKVMLLPDGGDNWQVEEAAKGVYHLKIIAKGKSAHGSRPWEGNNALEKLMDFISDLRAEFQCNRKSHYCSTLNTGKIEGGEVANQIPDRAEALIDIRYVPEQSKDAIDKIIDKIERRYQGIKIEEVVSGDSFKLDKRSKYIDILKRILKKNDIKLDWTFAHGASDGRFFAAKGVPVIQIKPKVGGHHSDEEWIDLSSLEKYYRFVKDFTREVAKK
jgi:acetylornithine deacetylase/succinyl-diaminopimelate desuccinylase-like protein